jgi:hypothetical protein
MTKVFSIHTFINIKLRLLHLLIYSFALILYYNNLYYCTIFNAWGLLDLVTYQINVDLNYLYGNGVQLLSFSDTSGLLWSDKSVIDKLHLLQTNYTNSWESNLDGQQAPLLLTNLGAFSLYYLLITYMLVEVMRSKHRYLF